MKLSGGRVMSIQYPEQQQVLYQADPNVASTLKSIRERMHHICSTYVNRLVRVQTLDGTTYEGVIVRCDNGLIYLRVSNSPGYRQLLGPGPSYGFNPYGLSSYFASQDAILTLVLF